MYALLQFMYIALIQQPSDSPPLVVIELFLLFLMLLVLLYM